jgi:hypothetical protein
VLTQAILSLAFCNWVVMAPWLGWASGLAGETSRSPALLVARLAAQEWSHQSQHGRAPSSFSNNV